MYEITNSIFIKSLKRTSDNVFIPFDESNIDYQAYLEWIEEGNQPIEIDISTVNPEEV
jgi:hypothetical protein